MKKKSFVYGALILALSSVICKILGAIFRIPLTYLIGVDGVGIYQLVYPIFALLLVASSSGVPVAISKIVSKENSKGNFKNSKIIFKESLKLMLILGVVFSIVIIIFSGIISSMQGRSGLQICYIILAPCIIFGCAISALRGYFQGFEIMKYSAISQIIEQLFKVLFGLLFAYLFLPYGLIYGVCGAFLGLIISEFCALIYLIIVFRMKKGEFNSNVNKDTEYTKKQAIKLIITEAVPITLSAIIIPLTSVVDSLIIIKLLGKVGFSLSVSTSLYGLDSGVVASLINLPSVVAISLGISLIPSISASFANQQTNDVVFKSKLSLKLVWYFTLPCAVIFFLYSKEICYFLYGNLNNETFSQILVASNMIKLSSFSIIYISINQILITILQALNRSYFAFNSLLFASIIKVILTIILVLNSSINIYGLVISDVICFAFASIVNLSKVKSLIKFNFNIYEIFIVPLLSLTIMALILILFKILFIVNLNRLFIMISILVGFIIYLLLVVLLKGFNLKELKNTKLLNLFKRKKY